MGDPRQTTNDKDDYEKDLPNFEKLLNKTEDGSDKPKMPGGITIIVGPGMGVNTFFAYELVSNFDGDWKKGLFFCFCISIIYTILSILGISNYLIHYPVLLLF